MQLLEETSVQVKAMGQHDTGDVAKISRKGRNRKTQNKTRNQLNQMHAYTVTETILNRNDCVLLTAKYAENAANRITSQQFANQLEIRDKSLNSVDHKGKET